MNPFTAFCGKIYDFLLRLYPSLFRAEFGEEMRAVFLSRLSDSGREGLLPAAGVCGVELIDLPISAIREHLLDRKKGGYFPMNKKLPTTTILLFLPLIEAVFLLIVNPRFILRLFSDILGGLIFLGVVLSVCLSLLIFLNPSPETTRHKLGIALLSFAAVMALLMGPVLVMLAQFPAVTFNAPGTFLNEQTLIIIFLLIDLVLAAVMVFNIARNRRHGEAGAKPSQ
jgi:hypothetical protein